MRTGHMNKWMNNCLQLYTASYNYDHDAIMSEYEYN